MTRFILLFVAASCTFLPIAADPVKLILEMRGCDANAAPVVPAPLRIWTTPGGKPAWTNRGPKAKAPRGDFSELLKINFGHSQSKRTAFSVPATTHCITSCKRWRNFPGHVQEGRIPRCDAGANANWLVLHNLVEAIIVYERFARNLIRPPRII